MVPDSMLAALSVSQRKEVWLRILSSFPDPILYASMSLPLSHALLGSHRAALSVVKMSLTKGTMARLAQFTFFTHFNDLA